MPEDRLIQPIEDVAEEEWKQLAEKAQSSFWGFLGCEVVHANAHKAAIRLNAGPHHMNMLSIVHGGVLMSLLDNAMGLVVLLACPEEKTVTAHMNTHFLESSPVGTIRCVAEIVHVKGRTITLQGSVEDESGRLIAWGSGAYRILSKKTERERSV